MGFWRVDIQRFGNATVLTSWKDDSIRGDTNHDGNATVPLRNDWRALNIE